MNPLRIAVVGASGRMGRAIVRLASEEGSRLELVFAVAASDVGADAGELAGVKRAGVLVAGDVLGLAAARADVVVDFSSPAATRALAEAASKAKSAIVSGTTGLDAECIRALDEASQHVPVLWEPNMSVGVHVTGELVRRAIELLGLAYDIEVVETHHKRKVDAPSGTAKRLAEVAAAARDSLRDRGDAASRFVHGREGRPGVRPSNEIGVHAIRGGDVVGDHTVHLLGEGERIEITHRASSRDLFAHGALKAARWLAGKPAGRYGLGDVLR